MRGRRLLRGAGDDRRRRGLQHSDRRRGEAAGRARPRDRAARLGCGGAGVLRTEDAYERMWALFDEDLRKQGRSTRSISTCTARWSPRTPRTAKASCCAASAASSATTLPIVASLDYHANLTPEMARLATALVGYRTYPHIDMAVTGKRAVELLDKLLKEKRPVYRAYRQLDFLIPLVWQCTFIEPAKGIFDSWASSRRGEKSAQPGHRQRRPTRRASRRPTSPSAARRWCVYGHDKEAVEAAADKLAAAVEGAGEGVRRRAARSRRRGPARDRAGEERDEADRARRHAGQSRRRRHLRHGRAAGAR